MVRTMHKQNEVADTIEELQPSVSGVAAVVVEG